MKNLFIDIKRTALTLIVLASISSCSDDFLDVVPKGSLIAQNTEDYDLLLNNLTLLNHSGQTAIKMSPEVCGLDPFFSGSDLQTQNAFEWKADIYQPDEDMNEITDYIQQIYTYNKIINEVMGSNGDEDKKKEIQAEALAGRAWCNFQLINYFGKPYNSATAATDLGFPIIKEADVAQTVFVRATVQEVYDFIVEDLTKAIPDLPDASHRLRMSVGAAEAILGKVYVFMGDYDKGLTQLNNAFNTFATSSIETRLYDLNVTTRPGGVHAPSFFGPGIVIVINNLEAPYAKQTNNTNGFIGSEILLSPETSALYGATDIRFTNFFANAPFFSPPFSVAGVYRRTGPPNPAIGVSIPDVYLLRTECKARTGNLSGAVTDLQKFREHRMPVADATVPAGLSQTELIHYIMEERTREFSVQGYEWFTIRRLSTDPLFDNATYTHTVYNADGSVKETFTLSPERMVLRFNQKVLTANPNLENNQ